MMKLILENWTCHSHTTLDFQADACSFVVGANGSGKTSIRDAIEFLYLGTGELRGIGTKKELALLSISEGAKACSITLETDQVWVRRSMKPNGTQKIERATRPGRSAKWGEKSVVPPDKPLLPEALAPQALRVVLEPTRFWTMDARARRELLIFATQDSEAGRETILEALQVALHPESPLDTDALDQAATWVAAEGFRAAEKLAGETRATAKRTLADLDTDPPDLSRFTDQDVARFEKVTVEAMETKLELLRKDHTAASVREGVSTKEIEGRLSEAQRALAEVDKSEAYEDADLDAAKNLEAAQEAQGQAEAALEAAQSDLKANRDEIATLSQVPLGSTDKFEKPRACPAVDFEFACPVKRTTFVKHRGGEEPLIEDGDREQKLAEAKLLSGPAKVQVESTKAAIVAAIENSGAAQERVKLERVRLVSEEATMSAISRARERVQEIEGELNEARQCLKAGDTQESAQALAERIEVGSTMLSDRRAWGQIVSSHAETLEAAEKAQGQIDRWNAIALELKPDGIETKLGGGAREAFVELMGQASGLAGRALLSPNFEISVERDGQTWHPLQLSTTQKLALGVAIQHALASTVEFPFLIVDAIDLFDVAHRGAFSKFVKDVGPTYQAIIGLATLSSGDPNVPPEGFETFWLVGGEHGTVTTHLAK